MTSKQEHALRVQARELMRQARVRGLDPVAARKRALRRLGQP